jgi:crotonobetainyl-CoA:carnitine CoA-transferase CaiB-like acyl-CoA transferase
MIGLAERDRTGAAQFVDCSQLAAALDLIGPEIALANAGPVPPSGRRSRHYRFGAFCATADDTWIAIECVTAAHEQALEALWGPLDEVPARVRTLTAQAAIAALAGTGIPHAEVDRHLTASTIERRPGNLQRYIDPVAGELRYPEVPWVFGDMPLRAGPPLGPMGRDNAALPAILARWRSRPRVAGAGA